MWIHLEMGVVRERGVSLNTSGVECGIRKVEMCNSMCRKVIQSGAALKAIVRGVEGKVEEVTEASRSLEVYTLSSNRHSAPFDHYHQCSSN